LILYVFILGDSFIHGISADTVQAALLKDERTKEAGAQAVEALA
jgi:hypothetical protein